MSAVIYAVFPHDNYDTDAPVAAFTTRSLAEGYIARQAELRAEERALPDDDAAFDAWSDAHEDFVDSVAFGIATLDLNPPLP